MPCLFKVTTVYYKDMFKYAAIIQKGIALVAIAVIVLSLWSIWQAADVERTSVLPVVSEGAAYGSSSSVWYRPYAGEPIFGEQQMAWQFLYELQEKEEAYRLVIAAQAARAHARHLVLPDRSNIDCDKMKCIALTYDDGPDREFTPKLLDTLRERKAVATFFVVGNRVPTRESIVKRMVDEKHEVGNHTWAHDNLELLDSKQVDEQINLASDVIAKVTGKNPHFMRPPYAKHNANVDSQVNMPLALWNIDPKDWRDRDASTIYERVIGGARPGGVVVMHDTFASSIEATPRIIDELQRQGYVLITLSELFGVTDENVGSFSGQVLRGR